MEEDENIFGEEENEEEEMECEGYCEVRHFTLTFVYIVVFYLSSTFDLNERDVRERAI